MASPSAAKPTLSRSTRPSTKTRILSARLTESEYSAMESHAWAAGKTIADWVRESLLRELEAGSQRRVEQHVFTELVGVQLLLMNTLGPLLRGERMTGEQLDALLKQVQSTKARKAQELLSKRLHAEERGI